MLETEAAMQKAVEAARRSFSGVRTGRANPALVEKIQIEYYGAIMPLKQLASIAVPESRQLLITPFDRSSVPAIEKAIMASDLGITPQTGSDSIRIVLPMLTEDRRRDLIKVIKHYAEDSKVSIRNARHAAIDRIKKQEKDKEITEDDGVILHEKIQKLTDKYNHEIDEALKHKEIEIMEE
ncbi:MAG: ribosome recycling factor [Candidatus Margulisiibacteriota bacterium]